MRTKEHYLTIKEAVQLESDLMSMREATSSLHSECLSLSDANELLQREIKQLKERLETLRNTSALKINRIELNK